MGRESKAFKERTCLSCDQVMIIDANGIKNHSRMCVSAKAAGLILPGIHHPKVELVKLYD